MFKTSFSKPIMFFLFPVDVCSSPSFSPPCKVNFISYPRRLPTYYEMYVNSEDDVVEIRRYINRVRTKINPADKDVARDLFLLQNGQRLSSEAISRHDL